MERLEDTADDKPRRRTTNGVRMEETVGAAGRKPGRRRVLLAAVLCAGLGLFRAPPAGGVEAGKPVRLLNENEVDVGGLRVFVFAPLGRRYHPGCAFPLEVRIARAAESAAGAVTLTVRLVVREGERGAYTSTPPGFVLQPDGAGFFTFLVRAPATEAALNLSVRRLAAGEKAAASPEAGEEIFRASLRSYLRPVNAKTITAVLVSSSKAPPTLPATWRTTLLAPERLPEAFWMWEGVDVVVLDENAITAEVAPPAVAALRRWVLGGGRLFIGRRKTLRRALRAGLLPVSPAADLKEWNKPRWWVNRGALRAEDFFVKDERGSTLYARFRLGLGGGVFRFPGADEDELRRARRAAFDGTVFRPRRPLRPDVRVDPKPFGFFVPGKIAPGRGRRALSWAVVGALCLLICVSAARCSRTGFWATMALGTVLLLTAFLARTFPPPRLSAARVTVERFSRDGRALDRTVLLRLESFGRPATVAVSSPLGGLLRVERRDAEELETTSFLLREAANGPAVSDLRVTPQQPRLLRSDMVEELTPKKGRDAAPRLKRKGLELVLPPGFPLRETLKRSSGTACLVLDDDYGVVYRLSGLGGRGNFKVEDYPGAGETVRRSYPGLAEEERFARTNLLRRVLQREVFRLRRPVLVFSLDKPGETPGGGENGDDGGESVKNAGEEGGKPGPAVRTSGGSRKGLETVSVRLVRLVEVECFGKPKDVVE